MDTLGILDALEMDTWDIVDTLDTWDIIDTLDNSMFDNFGSKNSEITNSTLRLILLMLMIANSQHISDDGKASMMIEVESDSLSSLKQPISFSLTIQPKYFMLDFELKREYFVSEYINERSNDFYKFGEKFSFLFKTKKPKIVTDTLNNVKLNYDEIKNIIIVPLFNQLVYNFVEAQKSTDPELILKIFNNIYSLSENSSDGIFVNFIIKFLLINVIEKNPKNNEIAKMCINFANKALEKEKTNFEDVIFLLNNVIEKNPENNEIAKMCMDFTNKALEKNKINPEGAVHLLNNVIKVNLNSEDKINFFLSEIVKFKSSYIVTESICDDFVGASDSKKQEIVKSINNIIEKENLSTKRKRSLIALAELILGKDADIPSKRLIEILKRTKDMNKVKLIAERKNLTLEVKKILFKKWINLYKEKKNWLYFLGKTIVNSKKINESVKEVVVVEDNFMEVVSSKFIENILKADKSKFVIDKILEKFGKRQMSLISLSETREILYHVVCAARDNNSLPKKELINIETKVLDKLRYANNLENKTKTSKIESLKIESLELEAKILKDISSDMVEYSKNSPKRVICAQKKITNLSSKFKEFLRCETQIVAADVDDDEFYDDVIDYFEPKTLTNLNRSTKDILINLTETNNYFNKRKFGFSKERSGPINTIRQFKYKQMLQRSDIIKLEKELSK